MKTIQIERYKWNKGISSTETLIISSSEKLPQPHHYIRAEEKQKTEELFTNTQAAWKMSEIYP